MDIDDAFEIDLDQELSILEEIENEVEWKENQKNVRKRNHSPDIEESDAKKQKYMAITNLSGDNAVENMSDQAIQSAVPVEDINVQLNNAVPDNLPTQPEEVASPLPAIIPDDRDRSGTILSRIPLVGDYITITGTDKRRVYVPFARDEDLNMPVKSGKVLGGEEFYQLMDQAREELRRQEILRDTIVTLEDDDDGVSTSALWVDKYSPKSYTELISEESVNRTLLRWLKAWDHFVFGRPLPPSIGSDQQGLKSGEDEASEVDPADGRPVHKMVLLCGPPGLGKTTLAHVLVRHAGYRMVEMNASDDRSAEVFRTRLESATSTQGAVDDLRPVCLVVDEVDGAPAPAVEVLANAVRTPLRRRGDKGRKKGQLALHRPVICICNDLYATSLRTLRPLCLVLRIPEPDLCRIAGRLLSITREEGLRADMTVLTGLVEKSDRDLRACLNALQFLRSRGRVELTAHDLQQGSLGGKDVQKSLWSIWQEVFTLDRPQTRGGVKNKGSRSDRFQHILASVYAAGELEKIVQGLFENYLGSRTKDASMHSFVSGSDWLLFNDRISRLVGERQDYSLFRYASYLPVFFHLSFAGGMRKLEWPRQDQDAYQKTQRSKSVLDALTSGRGSVGNQASVLSSCGRTALILELVPALCELAQPCGLRPINTQLYSVREKALLADTVRLMLDAGVTFRQERTAEGQYVYVLEPDLESVSLLPGVRPQRRVLSYAAKQFIAREIGLEGMRRAEKALARSTAPARTPGPRPLSIADQMQKTRLAIGKGGGVKVTKDFFGRIVNDKISTKEDTGADGEQNVPEQPKSILNQAIWFRFKSGFSNAIRRPVKIRDLL